LINVKEYNFAAILTNPPIRAGKKTVHDIFEQSYEHLVTGGELWIVIQKKQGAPSALEKLKERFTTVETIDKSKGYFIIKAVK
jgi:16S rRNA (guanine1207-N2)-methyltransferase